MLKLNKNLRDKVIITIVFILILCGFLFAMRARNFAQNNQASIIEQKNQIETFLERILINKNTDELKDIEGAEALIKDLESNENLFDVNFEEVPGGVIVSFLGKSAGNTLHPYFGFFEVENDEVTIIHWGEQGKASLISENGDEMHIKNNSSFAWNTNDKWENYTDLTVISLKSENGDQYVMPGEVGIFTAKTNNKLTPKNINHEYLILVD